MDKRKGSGYSSQVKKELRPSVAQSLFSGFFLIKRGTILEGKKKEFKFLSPKRSAFSDLEIRKISNSITPDFLDNLKSIKKNKSIMPESLDVCAMGQFPSPYINKKEWKKDLTRGKSINIIRRPSQSPSIPLLEKTKKKIQLAKIRVFHSISNNLSQAKPPKIYRKKSFESPPTRNNFLLELKNKISNINGSLL